MLRVLCRARNFLFCAFIFARWIREGVTFIAMQFLELAPRTFTANFKATFGTQTKLLFQKINNDVLRSFPIILRLDMNNVQYRKNSNSNSPRQHLNISYPFLWKIKLSITFNIWIKRIISILFINQKKIKFNKAQYRNDIILPLYDENSGKPTIHKFR